MRQYGMQETTTGKATMHPTLSLYSTDGFVKEYPSTGAALVQAERDARKLAKEIGKTYTIYMTDFYTNKNEDSSKGAQVYTTA